MTATAGWRDGLYGSDRQRESLRELIHELRTPLNAIMGFAEIIDHQFFGPVGVRYREIAQDIVADAQKLLGTFDDLDLASRIERGDFEAAAGVVNPAELLHGLAARFRRSEEHTSELQSLMRISYAVFCLKKKKKKKDGITNTNSI